MIRNRVLPIQFASLLVAVPVVFGVLANAYIKHDDDDDDGYYDGKKYYSGYDENNYIEDHHRYEYRHPNYPRQQDNSAGYKYQYQVNSPNTGDFKTQHEERIGDTVRGSYSLMEPDGSVRIVEYTADPKHGFKAVVKREPPNMHSSHRSAPEIVEPMPITKPPPIPQPTPIRPPKPVRVKYPPKLIFSPTKPTYYRTTSPPKVRNTPPSKYTMVRFHGWPSLIF